MASIPEYIRTLRRQLYTDVTQIVAEEVQKINRSWEFDRTSILQEIRSTVEIDRDTIMDSFHSMLDEAFKKHLASYERKQCFVIDDMLSSHSAAVVSQVCGRFDMTVQEHLAQSSRSKTLGKSIERDMPAVQVQGDHGTDDVVASEQNGVVNSPSGVLKTPREDPTYTNSVEASQSPDLLVDTDDAAGQLDLAHGPSLNELMSHLYAKNIEDMANVESMAVAENEYQQKHRYFFDKVRDESHSYLNYFDGAAAVIILLQTIFLGIESEVMMMSIRKGEYAKHDELTVVELIFTGLFLLEFVVRIIIFRENFFKPPNRNWHLFDTFLFVIAVVEIIVLGPLSTSRATLVFRALRIARMFRIARIVRTHVFFRELRMIVYGLVLSVRSLLWSVIFLLLTVYLFAVVFLQAVANFLFDNRDEFTADLRLYFGSLYEAMTTLLMSISGGEDWGRPMRVLSNVHWVYMYLFVMYIMLSIYGVLNVVTGIFVESAMLSSKNDSQLVGQEELSQKAVYIAKMRHLFKDFDKDNSGTLTWEEFEDACRGEVMLGVLATLQIDVIDAQHLFGMLDVGDRGAITIDEFLIGCWNMKGQAKALTLAEMQWEQKKSFNILVHKFHELKVLLRQQKKGDQVGLQYRGASRAVESYIPHDGSMGSLRLYGSASVKSVDQ